VAGVNYRKKHEKLEGTARQAVKSCGRHKNGGKHYPEGIRELILTKELLRVINSIDLPLAVPPSSMTCDYYHRYIPDLILHSHYGRIRMCDTLFWPLIRHWGNGGGGFEILGKGGSMMKKYIVLFISSLIAFSLGIAYAEEDRVLNPWEQIGQTSPKKEGKAKTKAIKTNKKEARKGNAEKVKKTNIAKAEKTSMEKAKKTDTEKAENAGAATAEKKETGQKKKFLFW
jgi:hypothetical protein